MQGCGVRGHIVNQAGLPALGLLPVLINQYYMQSNYDFTMQQYSR